MPVRLQGGADAAVAAFGGRKATSATAADTLTTLMADLHASGISVEILLLNDYGDEWRARLGDPLNGYKAEGRFHSLRDAIEWLRDKAIEIYPNSEFAKEYRRGFG